MSRRHDLDASVAAYDTELVPWLFEHWAEPMVALVAPEPSSRIVDLACGSGLIVRHLLRYLDRSGELHGVDIDAAMLAGAAATIDDRRVTWHEADATRLPFETASVDRVSCHQGLQFFPDRPAALSEICRVLAPGGRLGVATWGRLEDNPWPMSLSTAVGMLLGDDAGAAMAIVCDLGDPDGVSELLRGAGFENVTVREQTRTATHHEVSAAIEGQLAALPSGSDIDGLTDEQRAGLVEHMCELLADHTDATGLLAVTSTCILAAGTAPPSDDRREGIER